MGIVSVEGAGEVELPLFVMVRFLCVGDSGEVVGVGV